MTFRKIYCTRNRIDEDHFESEFMRRALYWPGRILWPVLRLIPGIMAEDRHFIKEVGDLSHLEDYRQCENDFLQSGIFDRVVRNRLKLRVSARRVRALVKENWPG